MSTKNSTSAASADFAAQSLRLLFGKHKGKPLTKMPNSYLFWLVSGSCRLSTPELRAAAREELAARFKDPEAQL